MTFLFQLFKNKLSTMYKTCVKTQKHEKTIFQISNLVTSVHCAFSIGENQKQENPIIFAVCRKETKTELGIKYDPFSTAFQNGSLGTCFSL